MTRRVAPARVALLGLAAVALTALVSCGAPTDASSGSATILLAPSADPFVSAIIMTRTWAASEIETVILSTIDGTSRQRHGRGEVAIDKGYAVIDWVTDGAPSRELVNDRAIFTQPQPPAGPWTRTESTGSTPTSPFADPLRWLTDVRDVRLEGTDTMDGFDTNRYQGTLPLTSANLDGLGLTALEEQRILAAAGPDDAIVVTAWEDPHHRLVRIDRSLDLGTGSALQASVLASTHLWDFGIMLDLESPPSASVTAPPA